MQLSLGRSQSNEVPSEVLRVARSPGNWKHFGIFRPGGHYQLEHQQQWRLYQSGQLDESCQRGRRTREPRIPPCSTAAVPSPSTRASSGQRLANCPPVYTTSRLIIRSNSVGLRAARGSMGRPTLPATPRSTRLTGRSSSVSRRVTSPRLPRRSPSRRPRLRSPTRPGRPPRSTSTATVSL